MVRKRRWILLIVLIILGLAIAGIAYARFAEPAMLTVTTVQVPSDTHQLKIALFSDTHFGRDYSQENMKRIREKINRQNPDLTVFVGDFFDNFRRDSLGLDLDYLGDQLSLIDGPKFAVYGNHDYGGWAQTTYKELMEQGGFTLLAQETACIEALDVCVVGFDDPYFGKSNKELYTLATGHYTVVLAHKPDLAAGITSETDGIILSGHSHGGQIRLPFITNHILPAGARKFSKGLYSAQEAGGTIPLYVTSGIGTTLWPLRFGNVPEIVILEIGA